MINRMMMRIQNGAVIDEVTEVEPGEFSRTFDYYAKVNPAVRVTLVIEGGADRP